MKAEELISQCSNENLGSRLLLYVIFVLLIQIALIVLATTPRSVPEHSYTSIRYLESNNGSVLCLI